MKIFCGNKVFVYLCFGKMFHFFLLRALRTFQSMAICAFENVDVLNNMLGVQNWEKVIANDDIKCYEKIDLF